MTKTETFTGVQRQTERGNALFLILIAVVLFAALSYAITQSNRSGANPSRETNLIASTTVTQYPSAIRTAITRMLLRGVTAEELLFTAPAASGTYVDDATYQVFNPTGGGAVFQNVDPNTVELDSSGTPLGSWNFRIDKPVTLIGTTTEDVVAVLTRVKKGICERINEQITGSTDIPTIALDDSEMIDDTTIVGVGIDGQPFLCVETADNHYVYYHVLVEQ